MISCEDRKMRDTRKRGIMIIGEHLGGWLRRE
jgi:hypothetical protein